MTPFDTDRLIAVWTLLLAITLACAFLAESAAAGVWPVLAVCGAVALKGRLVIDWLMGLAGTARPVRWSLLAYFYLLTPVIALAWLFPGWVARLTTL